MTIVTPQTNARGPTIVTPPLPRQLSTAQTNAWGWGGVTIASSQTSFIPQGRIERGGGLQMSSLKWESRGGGVDNCQPPHKPMQLKNLFDQENPVVDRLSPDQKGCGVQRLL